MEYLFGFLLLAALGSFIWLISLYIATFID
jgi:hypothetical protein